MTPAARLSLVIVAMFGLLVCAVAGSFALSDWAIGRSQHQWCTTLTLLTEHPVPYPSDAKENPSRLATYQLYQDFVQVRGEFGC